MPVVENSTYSPARGFRNPHVQIIWCSLLRKVPPVAYRREVIPTPDGDELHLDWTTLPGPAPATAPKRTLVILHGLESHARLRYVTAAALPFLRAGWEVAALNFRDCGDTPNRLWQSYHSGISQDVGIVVEHLVRSRPDREIALLGFSLGGNVVLRYMGAHVEEIPSAVKAAVAVSSPVDVASAVTKLAERSNRFYHWRFLKTMRWKLRRRCERFPGMMDAALIPKVRSFREFDDLYTAPAHGFPDAMQYYAEASSHPHLERIQLPTLLINALDDPFLGANCFPTEAASANPHFHLETPAHGSHIGFVDFATQDGACWHERRVFDFLQSHVP